ncbi:MAG: methylmalonyl-CoA epimerase [Cytophagaceae bacterium]
MKKPEHIGIAVKDLNQSVKLFSGLLNQKPYKEEEVDSEKVKTVFFQSGGVKIELLQSTEAGGIIDKFIEKRGEGIHHIAFEVEDIDKEIARLKEEGFEFVSEKPKKGADNKLIAFLHPKTTNGVLIEICQEIKKEAH